MKAFKYDANGLIFINQEQAVKINKTAYSYKGISVYSDIYNVYNHTTYIKIVINRTLNPALITKARSKKFQYINKIANEIAKLIF